MKKLLIIFLFSSIIFSCSSIKVVTDVDKTVDFTQFKTFEYYGWAEGSDNILNDLDKRRIETAFNEEFNKRGMKYVKENGDVIVTLYIVTQQKTEQVATTTSMGMYGYGGYYGYGPRWGWGPGYGGGMSTTTINNVDYTVGTLICSVYDAGEKKLIWEGVGTKTLEEKTKGREQRIKEAVGAIMYPYPVKPKTKKQLENQ